MTQTTITDVGAVAIPVADQDKALAFYTETLGFETGIDAPTPNGGRWVTVTAPAGRVSISLIAASSETPAGIDTGIRLTATNANQAHEALTGRGVDVDDIVNWPGVPPMFSFRDLDGNTLYLTETVTPEDER